MHSSSSARSTAVYAAQLTTQETSTPAEALRSALGSVKYHSRSVPRNGTPRSPRVEHSSHPSMPLLPTTQTIRAPQGSLAFFSVGKAASLGETSTLSFGQQMPRSGSSHLTPASLSLSYSAVHL